MTVAVKRSRHVPHGSRRRRRIRTLARAGYGVLGWYYINRFGTVGLTIVERKIAV